MDSSFPGDVFTGCRRSSRLFSDSRLCYGLMFRIDSFFRPATGKGQENQHKKNTEEFPHGCKHPFENARS